MRALEKQITTLRTSKDALEKQLLDQLDAQGVQSVSGHLATAYIAESIVPSIDDWDSFHAFVRKNNAFYLLQRRVNAAPYRELMAERRNRKIPGATSVTLRTLNLKAR